MIKTLHFSLTLAAAADAAARADADRLIGGCGDAPDTGWVSPMGLDEIARRPQPAPGMVGSVIIQFVRGTTK